MRPHIRELGVLVGDWRVEGRNAPTSGGGPGARVEGTQVYAWLAGEHFLTGRWDRVFDDGGRHTGLAVLGASPAGDHLASVQYDNLGFARAYRLELHGRRWTLTGEHERAGFVLAEDGATFIERWEQRVAGADWLPLCELRATRIAPR